MNEIQDLKNIRIAIEALKNMEQQLLKQRQPNPKEEVRNTLVDEQVDHNYRWKQKEGRDVWVAVIEYQTTQDEELVHSPYPRQEVLTEENNALDTLLDRLTAMVKDIVVDGYTLLSVRVQTYHVIGELDVEKVLNGGYEE